MLIQVETQLDGRFGATRDALDDAANKLAEGAA